MNIEEIKKEFDDCDWMRAVLNTWTVDAVIWLIAEVDRLTPKPCNCKKCGGVGVEDYYTDE